MDAAQGSKKVLSVLGFALMLGVPVIAFNSAYRQAFLCIIHGKPAESLIWKSNLEYYPNVTLPADPMTETSEPAEPEARHDAK